MAFLRDPGFGLDSDERKHRERAYTTTAGLIALTLLLAVGMGGLALYRWACCSPTAIHFNEKPRS